MKILYLYSEVMGYTLATVLELVKRGYEVHIVHWDHKKLTPYQPPVVSNVFMYKRSEYSKSKIQHLVNNLMPSLIVVSGWMDKDYMSVVKEWRSRGVPVVVGIDDQWQCSARQIVAVLLATTGYFSRFYSHAWVAGLYQYEYVRRLGFKKNQILFDLYSADLGLLNQACKLSLSKRKIEYKHRFLFVGRFDSNKGVDVLLKAWNEIRDHKNDWELHLIGGGGLKEIIKKTRDVVIKDFMQPESLARELANAACVVIPSEREPWGVVTHEFSTVGLPLIVADVVGASPTFLISGFNGFKFETGNYIDLANKMRKIIGMSDQELFLMGDNSRKLSMRITPESSACNLLSILN
jgi:glycosyltransferase involved in cell wall biosynthesis